MPRLRVLLHRAGSVVGALTALVAIIADDAGLFPPHIGARVAGAGAALAMFGKAIVVLERVCADEPATDGERVQAAIQAGGDATAFGGD